MPVADTTYHALLELLESMDIVDSHEHLPSETARLATMPDFSLLFSNYCSSDLLAAGMPKTEADRFIGDAAPVDEKWALFAPYYPHIAEGSYARAAHLAMRQFYGLERLESLADAEALTTALRANNTPGLYQRVLREACHIRKVVNYGNLNDDPEWFAPVIFVTHFIETTPAAMTEVEAHTGIACTSLNRYIYALHRMLRDAHARGMRGLKHNLAYMRDLSFPPVTHADAEQVYNRLTEEQYGWRDVGLGYAERRPLQNYLMHRLCEIAEELQIPFVIHSALQTNADHHADDARPHRLWNLPHRYRKVQFVILHAGFPWIEDAALMAKHFPNVSLDLAWAHLMSPAIVTRCLPALIDMVPMQKIMGFGGDYGVVEKVYGHLTLARRNFARAFAAMIADDVLTRERAHAWLRAMLHDNPTRLFNV